MSPRTRRSTPLSPGSGPIGQEHNPGQLRGAGASAKTVVRDKKTGEIKQYPLENFERIVQIQPDGTFALYHQSQPAC